MLRVPGTRDNYDLYRRIGEVETLCDGEREETRNERGFKNKTKQKLSAEV